MFSVRVFLTFKNDDSDRFPVKLCFHNSWNFLGYLGLLWLIGRRTEAIEKQNLKKLQEIREAALKQIQQEVKKKQEYI